jgi:hypothetical protein
MENEYKNCTIMKKTILILSLILSQVLFSQEVTLNHNIGSNIIDQLFNFTCSGGGVSWAREFVLEDFDITGDYNITSGSFAVEGSNGAPGDGVIVNVYEIDAGFPGTFDETSLLGSSNLIDIPPWTTRTIFTFDFPSPIEVSSDIEMILVEVRLGLQDQNVFIGGTMDSLDYSWWNPLNNQSCRGDANTYQSTLSLNFPDLNYYITVTGDNVLSIDDPMEEIVLIINPVQDKLKIDIPAEVKVTEMIVYDINGKIMRRNNSVNNMDVSHFSSGLYFLNLRTIEGQIVTKKFIKE